MRQPVPDIIYHNPYPNSFYLFLDNLARCLMWTFAISIDHFGCCFLPITTELAKPYLLLHVYFIILPFYFIMTICSIPIGFVGYVIWFSIQQNRLKFRSSESSPFILHTKHYDFTFTTANLCLLPEAFSRFNNLNRTWWRAFEQGRVIAQAQLHKTFSMNGIVKNGNTSNQHSQKSKLKTSNMEPSTIPHFPMTDFLLLQEGSWQISKAERLGQQLHRAYPYIIYDIGSHSLSSNLTFANSGLMFASKYPIMAVDFKPFSKRCKQCKLASKGLLQVKVDLGFTSTGKREVGYIFNTHLQVYQGTDPIQMSQMDEMIQWTEEFEKETFEVDEVILFDILGGDFNLDNMSPVDRESCAHPIFNVYEDLGRDRAGRDHSWARGTELRQLLVHEPLIQTPHGLCHALADDILMQTYLLDSDLEVSKPAIAHYLAKKDEHGKIIPSPWGGRRRIDFVMPRKGTKAEVTGYNFVTALAGLTDHIPVSLSLRI